MTIAVCDQLAPAFGSNDASFSHASIPDFVRSLAFHCPPANVSSPVVTMAPDVADHHEHSREKILKQWRHTVDSSWPTWNGVQFDAIDRNDFYRRLLEASAVVHTLSDEPYANLLLTVNPASSESLRKIPGVVCLDLAEVLSRAGHSQAVVIAPSSHRHLFDVAPRALKLRYSCPPSHIARAVSHLWLPDTHAQNPKLPLQKPLGILCEDTLSAHDGIAALEGRWSDPSLMQALSLDEFNKELADPRVVVCIEATVRDSIPGVCYIMKNWLSGHNGGF